LIKKDAPVWALCTLTAISSLPLAEAVSILSFNGQTLLPQIYPFMKGMFQNLSPEMYFWASVSATFTLWGITCALAFRNLLKNYLNTALSDAKTETSVENKSNEKKNELHTSSDDSVFALDFFYVLFPLDPTLPA